MSGEVRTRLEIDLTALAANASALQTYVGPSTGLIAVVKDNAYGHGLVPSATSLARAGAALLAVSAVSEARVLEKALPQATVLLLNDLDPELVDLVGSEVHLTSTSPQLLPRLHDRAVALGTSVPVHLKIDTGMNRLGFPATELVEVLRFATSHKGLAVVGLCTHLPDYGTVAARAQLEIFSEVVRTARSILGPALRYVHAANSGVLLHHPEAHHTHVRPGIALYGIEPGGGSRLGLRPVMSLCAPIVQVRPVAAGRSIGYRRAFTADHDLLVGVVPIGYGHGFLRSFGPGGTALVGGRLVPVVGDISMDMLCLDLTTLPDPRPGQEAVLFGRSEDPSLRVEALALRSGLIPYEIMTGMSAQLPRCYHGAA